MSPRLYHDKRGREHVVEKCIECPRLPRCEEGAWRNQNVASGPVPFACMLRPIKDKTARKVREKNGEA